MVTTNYRMLQGVLWLNLPYTIKELSNPKIPNYRPKFIFKQKLILKWIKYYPGDYSNQKRRSNSYIFKSIFEKWQLATKRVVDQLWHRHLSLTSKLWAYFLKSKLSTHVRFLLGSIIILFSIMWPSLLCHNRNVSSFSTALIMPLEIFGIKYNDE